MGLLLSQPIAIARGVLNDTVAEYRYSDADLLEYGNGAIRALATLKPAFLYAQGELTCVAGKALQTVDFDDAHALVSVDSIKDGAVIHPCNKAALDAFNPSWVVATAAAAENWMPHVDSLLAFWLSPPAPVNQVVNVTYVYIPASFTASADTDLPVTLAEPIADYIIGMAESRDDEHALSGRAESHKQAFIAKVSGIIK